MGAGYTRIPDPFLRVPLYALPNGHKLYVYYSHDAKTDRLELILLKKKFLMCALLVLCLGFAVNGSLAYFTGQEIAHNVITSGNIDIELVEMAKVGDELVPFEDVDGMMPGSAASKIVYVTNTGANDAWVRIKLDKAVALEGEGQADLGIINLDLNLGTAADQWTEKDGYYYYNSMLKPTESTKPLFTEVKFDTGMGNEYKSSTVTIDVQAQATQVANNGATVLEAAGWPNA